MYTRTASAAERESAPRAVSDARAYQRNDERTNERTTERAMIDLRAKPASLATRRLSRPRAWISWLRRPARAEWIIRASASKQPPSRRRQRIISSSSHSARSSTCSIAGNDCNRRRLGDRPTIGSLVSAKRHQQRTPAEGYAPRRAQSEMWRGGITTPMGTAGICVPAHGFGTGSQTRNMREP